ncbi:hypothetical protein JCM10213_001528 [Rhodosporidiobolus nylandii]
MAPDDSHPSLLFYLAIAVPLFVLLFFLAGAIVLYRRIHRLVLSLQEREARLEAYELDALGASQQKGGVRGTQPDTPKAGSPRRLAATAAAAGGATTGRTSATSKFSSSRDVSDETGLLPYTSSSRRPPFAPSSSDGSRSFGGYSGGFGCAELARLEQGGGQDGEGCEGYEPMSTGNEETGTSGTEGKAGTGSKTGFAPLSQSQYTLTQTPPFGSARSTPFASPSRFSFNLSGSSGGPSPSSGNESSDAHASSGGGRTALNKRGERVLRRLSGAGETTGGRSRLSLIPSRRGTKEKEEEQEEDDPLLDPALRAPLQPTNKLRRTFGVGGGEETDEEQAEEGDAEKEETSRSPSGRRRPPRARKKALREEQLGEEEGTIVPPKPAAASELQPTDPTSPLPALTPSTLSASRSAAHTGPFPSTSPSPPQPVAPIPRHPLPPPLPASASFSRRSSPLPLSPSSLMGTPVVGSALDTEGTAPMPLGPFHFATETREEGGARSGRTSRVAPIESPGSREARSAYAAEDEGMDEGMDEGWQRMAFSTSSPPSFSSLSPEPAGAHYSSAGLYFSSAPSPSRPLGLPFRPPLSPPHTPPSPQPSFVPPARAPLPSPRSHDLTRDRSGPALSPAQRSSTKWSTLAEQGSAFATPCASSSLAVGGLPQQSSSTPTALHSRSSSGSVFTEHLSLSPPPVLRTHGTGLAKQLEQLARESEDEDKESLTERGRGGLPWLMEGRAVDSKGSLVSAHAAKRGGEEVGRGRMSWLTPTNPDPLSLAPSSSNTTDVSLASTDSGSRYPPTPRSPLAESVLAKHSAAACVAEKAGSAERAREGV